MAPLRFVVLWKSSSRDSGFVTCRRKKGKFAGNHNQGPLGWASFQVMVTFTWSCWIVHCLSSLSYTYHKHRN